MHSIPQTVEVVNCCIFFALQFSRMKCLTDPSIQCLASSLHFRLLFVPEVKYWMALRQWWYLDNSSPWFTLIHLPSIVPNLPAAHPWLMLYIPNQAVRWTPWIYVCLVIRTPRAIYYNEAVFMKYLCASSLLHIKLNLVEEICHIQVFWEHHHLILGSLNKEYLQHHRINYWEHVSKTHTDNVFCWWWLLGNNAARMYYAILQFYQGTFNNH